VHRIEFVPQERPPAINYLVVVFRVRMQLLTSLFKFNLVVLDFSFHFPQADVGTDGKKALLKAISERYFVCLCVHL
jgi:hypothetical protein